MIGDNDVHLWTFILAAESDGWELLSDEERARADRYHFEHDRGLFIAGRAQLRRILGSYLGRLPNEVRLRQDKFGKPRIEGPLFFNLSHSDDLAALAVASFEVGIDIERVRPIDIARADLFFAPGEIIALRSLREADRREGFFNCWTRKEAFVKALGMGLSYPLDRFCVSVEPGLPARMLSITDDSIAQSPWHLHHFRPAAQFIGAIAAQRSELNLVDMSLFGFTSTLTQC